MFRCLGIFALNGVSCGCHPPALQPLQKFRVLKFLSLGQVICFAAAVANYCPHLFEFVCLCKHHSTEFRSAQHDTSSHSEANSIFMPKNLILSSSFRGALPRRISSKPVEILHPKNAVVLKFLFASILQFHFKSLAAFCISPDCGSLGLVRLLPQLRPAEFRCLEIPLRSSLSFLRLRLS